MDYRIGYRYGRSLARNTRYTVVNTLMLFIALQTIRWVALIGADADTYGAIAGALLGAYHPNTVPQCLANQLLVKPDIDKLLP